MNKRHHRRTVLDITDTEFAHVKEQFGAALRDARDGLGWTQGEFADDVGVKQPTVSNWEAGRSLPRQRMLYHLCRWMGISLDHLFGCQRDRYTEKARLRAKANAA